MLYTREEINKSKNKYERLARESDIRKQAKLNNPIKSEEPTHYLANEITKATNNPLKNGARRVGEGAKSVGNKFLATIPYLFETSKQAAHDRKINLLNKKFKEAESQSDLQNAKREHEYRKAERMVFPDLKDYKAAAADAEVKKKLLKEISVSTAVPMNNWSSKKMRLANEQQQKALGGLSPVAQFVGETAMSIGQNAAILPSALLHPAAPLAIMGSMAAADKAYSLAQNGIGAGESLKRGIATGGIEAATEKLPLNEIMKMTKGVSKSFIKNTLKQTGVEATEEGISYALNYLSDLYAKDPNANFSTKDLAKAAAGGALSGSIMAGGASALGNVKKNKISDAEMFEVIGGKAKVLEHDAATQSNESTVKNPYNGAKPTQEKIKTFVPKISDESLKTAQRQIEYAKSKEAETGKSTRSFLEGFYEQIFDSMGGARNISIDKVNFESKPYVVTLNKNAVGKVISDSHLSAEKLSVFNNIDEIIKNGNYIESSTYVPHSKKAKLTVRFDYFETPIKIDNTDYIVRFDVEVFPSDKNYRVHKIINKMNLTPVFSANKAGPVPTATEKASDSYETNLPQSNNSVNTSSTQSDENYSQKEKNQRNVQENPPIAGFYAYVKDLQERYHTTDDDMLFSYLAEDERKEYMRLRSLEEKEEHGFPHAGL